MMKYYAERNNLVDGNLSIDLKTFKGYFNQLYRYFDNKGYFESAINGIWKERPYKDDEQVLSPSFSPSPEIFFLHHLKSDKVYPVHKYLENYTEETLFTVIEILYDHIAKYYYNRGLMNGSLDKDSPRQEYAEHVNNLLRIYKDGYYLEPRNGFISVLPNDALKEMLQEDLPDSVDITVIEQLKVAVKMYYRFNAETEAKKKAINILADILEPLRHDLQEILNQEYAITKNKHDKLIFDIVNNFNVRHNKETQYKEYSKDIWYDWMMQYYTSVILTYYKLKNKSEQ